MLVRLLAVLLLVGSAYAQHYVDLSWNPVDYTPLKYHVWRSKNCTGSYVKKHTTKYTYWTDIYVTAGVTYCYVVTAFNPVTLAESPYSNSIQVTIPSP